MKYNLKIGTFLGAPILLNLSICLVFIFFWATGDDFIAGILSGTAFIALMLLHEMGHAWFAKKYHHDLIKIHLYPIHGFCDFEQDPRYRPETLIYVGGLLVQLVVFVIAIIFFKTLDIAGLKAIRTFFEPVGYVFIPINLGIMVFNSLPIPGLDGYTLWNRLYYWLKAKLIFSKSKKRTQNPKMQSPGKIVDLAIKRAQNKKSSDNGVNK